MEALPAALAFQEKIEFSLSATSPHFDFGAGLAPFARFEVNSARAKHLALLSSPKSSGKLLGGDGTFHYADLQPIFFAADGRRLADVSLSPPIMRTYGLMGTYMYVRYAAVPEGAASVILGTSTRSVGKLGTITGTVPDGGIMVGTIFIPMPGGVRPFPYTLSAYGEAIALFSTNPPVPR